MTPAELAALIRAATTELLARRGLATGAVPSATGEIDWAREVVRPRDPGHGEYATAVALRAAASVGSAPGELATELAASLAGHPGIASAEVAGPGFVNVRLAPSARGAVLGQIFAEGAGYGRVVPFDLLNVDETLAERVGGHIDTAAARYALHRDPGCPLDERLLARQVDANPAFRVRFAHARLCALARHAEALGVPAGERYELLEHPRETALIGALGEFGQATSAGAYRLTRYLERLAGDLEAFELDCRVLPMGDEVTTELHSARVALCAAARQVFANGLRLLGVDAPERM